jgi:hypothetical protein
MSDGVADSALPCDFEILGLRGNNREREIRPGTGFFHFWVLTRIFSRLTIIADLAVVALSFRACPTTTLV